MMSIEEALRRAGEALDANLRRSEEDMDLWKTGGADDAKIDLLIEEQRREAGGLPGEGARGHRSVDAGRLSPRPALNPSRACSPRARLGPPFFNGADSLI